MTCLFCGTEIKAFTIGHGARGFSAICPECGARGPWKSNELKAREAWICSYAATKLGLLEEYLAAVSTPYGERQETDFDVLREKHIADHRERRRRESREF